MKKLLSLLLLTLMLLLLAGCSTTKAPEQSSEKTPEPNGTIKVGFIGSSGTSPQPLINQKYTIFADQLKPHGKSIEFVRTRSLDKVWPIMDKEDSPEFFYIPASNFATYVTATSRFGGSEKYVIVAGSFNTSGPVLIAGPHIKSLKDLAGKKVAIANNRYMDEFQLNKLLTTVDLGTETAGGTVKIAWADVVPKMIEDWGKGEYDAIVLYVESTYPTALAKLQGSRILTNLHPLELYDEAAPRYWLVVKKDFLKKEPLLVKEFLKAHILSTEKAISDKKSLPAINREIYLELRKEQNYDVEAVAKSTPLEQFVEEWKRIEITYDPNYKYTSEIFDFLKLKELQKGTVDGFINIDPLNEALQEMGKPKVK